VKFPIILFLFLVGTAQAEKTTEKLLENSSPECKAELHNFDEKVGEEFKEMISFMVMDEINNLMMIRRKLISESAISSQKSLDSRVLAKLNYLINSEGYTYQIDDIQRINKELLKSPLKVSKSDVTNLKEKFKVVGI